MRKTIPLLLAKTIYENHKRIGGARTLNIIIDEAHNILSQESFRESESWKDYRLETFEEIIKEGRKFGVFVTIASQRPNDISHTLTSVSSAQLLHSQAHQ
jgi:DNA helicase HerA-like ATPase